MNNKIRTALSDALGRSVEIVSTCDVSGGCINQGQVLTLDDGACVFVKINGNPPAGMFSTEARGLELLSQAQEGPRIPKVIWQDQVENSHFLILEYVENVSPSADFYPKFGQALANLHRTTSPAFGLDHDNFIGSTPQMNTQENDALVFFRDHRLGFQQRLARQANLLPAHVDQQLDKLRDQLETFIDVTGEQPALIHGDLWSGNHFCSAEGEPVIFDPAAHFGLREADLAMTELFGRLPDSFYQAYGEAFPLNPGYAERKPVFNLYHLLNHLNLFGGSYLGSVENTLRHYVG